MFLLGILMSPMYRPGDCFIDTFDLESWQEPHEPKIVIKVGKKSYLLGKYIDILGFLTSTSFDFETEEYSTKRIKCPDNLREGYIKFKNSKLYR